LRLPLLPFPFMTFDPRFSRPAVALTKQPVAKSVQTPATRAFQIQLTRVGKLKSQLGDMDLWAMAHRQALVDQVEPLKVAHRALLRRMVHLIDARLSGKALSAPLKEVAAGVLCGMARTLAQQGDAEMAQLHDRHAPVNLAQLDARQAGALRAQLEQALGSPIDDLPLDASADEILAVGIARLRQQREDEKELRRESVDRKKAKKKPSAVQAKNTAEQADASDLLRSLFRRLASALHPDRETDAQARARKTELMGQANAAYARKDLVALMELQQTAELTLAAGGVQWAADQLVAMTLLLKQQVADLERERAARQDALTHEFDVPAGLGVTSRTLQMVLNEQVLELEQTMALMDQDLEHLQSDAGFKRWLKQQQAVARMLGLA
jgi:hypothetical protein